METIMMFLLVCTGAFFWGVINILEKIFVRKKARVEIMVIATMLGASIFSFLTQFIILGAPKISSGFWLPFSLSIFVVLGVRYWGIKALKTEDVSIVAALLGLTPIFVIATSWFILNEFPTFYGLIGILLATFGIYSLNLKGQNIELSIRLKTIIPKKLQKPILFFGAPFFRLFSTQGARLAFLVAIICAVGLNLDKMMVLNSSPFMVSATVFLAVALIMYLGLRVKGSWNKTDKRFFLPLLGVGLIVGLSNVLMNSGFLYGIVPYVGVLKRTQIIWTIFLAHWFLKEKLTWWKLLGVIMLFAGIILIAF